MSAKNLRRHRFMRNDDLFSRLMTETNNMYWEQNLDCGTE
jgi:hypothetical protein